MRIFNIALKMFIFFFVVFMMIMSTYTFYEGSYTWTMLFVSYGVIFTYQLNFTEKGGH